MVMTVRLSPVYNSKHKISSIPSADFSDLLSDSVDQLGTEKCFTFDPYTGC